MEITKEVANKLWRDVFGETVVWATDCFGAWIYRDDYGKFDIARNRPNGDGKDYSYGWSIDHIMPVAKGGKDEWNNFEPMHIENIRSKSDDISFKINDAGYQVIKCNLSPSYGYGIIELKTGLRVDWKGKQERWYR